MLRCAVVLLPLLLASPAGAAFDFTQDWYETGTVGDGWADAVSTVGDVNGDGYSDILVGAPNFGGSPSFSQGKIYLYFGSPSGPSNTPDWSFSGLIANAQLGWAIAPAGDMNADGYDDFVVGAPGHSGGNPSEGRLYFFLGSSTFPVWWTQAEVNEDDARLGHSVAYAGDVNGDGYDDIIAGAPGWGGFGSPFFIPVQGRAYVYHGGPNGPDGTADRSWSGGDVNGDFGWAVAGLGDVNGDGYADVMVGKPRYDPGIIDSDFGAIYAYYGSASGLPSSANWSRIGDHAGDRFGSVLTYAGDFDANGYCDLLVGVPDYNGGAGGVYFAAGGASGLGAATLMRSGYSSSWGGSVSTIGDFNGDGYGDFVVGGGVDDDAYVYFGTPIANANAVINGTQQFATTVASAGDVNGDGLGDFLVTDPIDQLGAGSVRLYLGGRELNGVPLLRTSILGNAGEELGASIAGAGDVNGDGIDDLVAGAPDTPDGGEAHVYLGGTSTMSTTPAWIATGSGGNGRFGSAVGAAGDVNGDGYADVIVGDPVTQQVRVYHGSPTGPSTLASWTHTFDVANADFGAAVGGGGDLNGDGYADVVVGAPLFDGSFADEGKVRVFFGSPTGVLSAGFVDLEPGYAGARFGQSLALLGDANGDGFDDLAVGAPGYFAGGMGADGRVEVHFGGAGGFSGGVFHANGAAAGNQFGFDVAAAGDVDGDGYADLLIGEPFSDVGGADAGRAHVFFGAPSPFLTFVAFASAGSPGDIQFGRSVTGLGDIDGSGRSFVAVSRLSSDQLTTKIAVFAYSGSMQSLATIQIGNAGWDVVVRGTGDVDADGSPDIGIGLPAGNPGVGSIRIHGPIPKRAPTPPHARPRVATTAGDPLALRGLVSTADDLRFRTLGWSPVGRTRLRVQWGLAEERQSWSPTGFGSWTPATTPLGGTELSADPNAFLAADERYRWRIRVEAANPFAPFGAWMTAQPNASSLYALHAVNPPVSGVGDDAAPPVAGILVASPNPFAATTRLEFALRESRDVVLEIYDVSGRRVSIERRGPLPPGTHQVTWGGTDAAGNPVASGVYYAVLRAGTETKRVKLTLAR